MARAEGRVDDEMFLDIADAIVAGANLLLPSEVQASVVDDDALVLVRGEFVGRAGIGTILRDRRPVRPDDVSEVAETILGWLQDVVSEDRAWPWPPVPGEERRTMATGRASVSAGVLRLWFEANGQPVTEPVVVPLALG